MAIIKDTNILDNLIEVWFKRFQGNGYYPIEKYAWDNLEKRWIRFIQKRDSKTLKDYWYRTTSSYTHKDFKYMVINNAGLLSDSELRSNNEYNDR